MTNRRTFFMQGGAGIVGAAAFELARTGARGAGANETLVLGAIGCGGRGTSVARDFAGISGVEVAYVCDPDQSHAENASTMIAKVGGKAPKAVNDLRRVLDDRSVDAVLIATPDHWHAPAAILACDAGKHVYVEKPCSHNFREGQLLVEAARRSGKVVQHGTQARSQGLVTHAIRHLHEGVIGEVLAAKALNVQLRKDIGHASPSEPPTGFDYDLWLGPAPFVPFQKNRHHYTWHWWYDYGTGDMGNDGVHELDIARWGLGEERHPTTIAAIGGKSFFKDDQQFPDTQYVAFEYAGNQEKPRRQLIFEMRIWSPYEPDGIDNGNLFYGTDGWMLLSKRGIVKVFDAKNRPRALPDQAPKTAGNQHQVDFVEAIRNGRRPNAEIAIGHLSASLTHLGNIATRLGRTLHFDPSSEQIVGDDEAARMLRRTYRDQHWAIPKGV